MGNLWWATYAMTFLIGNKNWNPFHAQTQIVITDYLIRSNDCCPFTGLWRRDRGQAGQVRATAAMSGFHTGHWPDHFIKDTAWLIVIQWLFSSCPRFTVCCCIRLAVVDGFVSHYTATQWCVICTPTPSTFIARTGLRNFVLCDPATGGRVTYWRLSSSSKINIWQRQNKTEAVNP